MYGAIIGDIVGSPYEFEDGFKEKDFPLFSKDSDFTDDTVMTLAVCEALMLDPDADDAVIRTNVSECMQRWGRKYPDRGYGERFIHWLFDFDPRPYKSFGNGSAMRVSGVGWLYDTVEMTRHVAKLTAEVTHNHPEGIKGAEAIASAIWLARNGKSKDEIRQYVETQFNYDLSRTCDEIRPGNKFDASCQGSVPVAFAAFFEGTDFEDVVRLAVSLGGDSDTIADMAGAVAEAFYGVPSALVTEVTERLPEDLAQVLISFNKMIDRKGQR